VFRAKDEPLPAPLDAYAQICAAAGSPTRHLKILAESLANIVAGSRELDEDTPTTSGQRPYPTASGTTPTTRRTVLASGLTTTST
jgi:hypothetical protein